MRLHRHHQNRLVLLGLLALALAAIAFESRIPVWVQSVLSRPYIETVIYIALAIAALTFKEGQDVEADTLIPAKLPLRALVVGIAPILGIVGGAVFVYGSIQIIGGLHFIPELKRVVAPEQRWAITAALVALLYAVIVPAFLECWYGIQKGKKPGAPITQSTPPAGTDVRVSPAPTTEPVKLPGARD